MNTSNLLVQELKAAYNLSSDYAVAKKLHITHQAIGNISKKNSQFGDKTIFKVAKLLKKNPANIWLKIQSEQMSDAEMDLIDADLLSQVPDAGKYAENLETIGSKKLAETLDRAVEAVSSPTDKKILEQLNIYYVK